MRDELLERVGRLRRRIRIQIVVEGLLALVAVALVLALVSYGVDRWLRLGPISRLALLGGGTLALLVIIFGISDAFSQDFDEVQIQVEQVKSSLYMLQGLGGNIAVSVGEDGTIIIDDQYAPLTEKIVAAIASFADEPVGWLINTHWHVDHTDGNENFGRAGALIVSHQNSRNRMEADQFIPFPNHHQEAYSQEGLPKITFDESVRFNLNGETIDVFYLGPAHTNGDAMVYFRDSNVIHTGDVFVRYGVPFIDQPNGGSINGMIDVVSKIAELTDDDTVFIPGHGPKSNRKDLLEYTEILKTIRDRVRAFIKQGYSFEAIVEENPADGFLATIVPTDDFLRMVYDSLLEEI